MECAEGILVDVVTSSAPGPVPHTLASSQAGRGVSPACRQAGERARQFLLAQQRPDGHWVAELQGDTILESEYVLLQAFLGREDDARVAKACRYLLAQQTAEGGWSNHPGGPLEVSVSVKAYFALKLAGHDPDAPPLRRAREAILAHGGAARCNSFTRFYLALLGQVPYDACPAVPPELLLLPRWFPFNLHAMSAWTRTIVVPLSIQSAYKPVRHLPPEKGIRELFLGDREEGMGNDRPVTSRWARFFLLADRAYKVAERWGLLAPFRGRAVRRAAEWMRERFADSDGLGAIFPPMVYTVIALRCLGVADDDPEMRWALGQLEGLMIEEGDSLRLQPCLSPVWDTALTVVALADAGLSGEHPALRRATDWLLAREVRRKGDWSIARPDLEPGGWFFEYRNGFYPDTDDTAMVLMALARVGLGTEAPAVRRGLAWLLGMQNRNGGWGAFDRDIDWEVLTQVPFADHNAMLDPSCPDITARVLEALGHHGVDSTHPQVRRALAFLARTQEPAGCWPGRWGVNYLYGTWQVLQGLRAIGYDMGQPMVRRAVDWLKGVQQAGGGWGESCQSYDDPSLAGQGPPTPSQTAWALLGLWAAGEAGPSIRAGLDYLLANQLDDGTWEEEPFTGTGFPKVFYLKYHFYRIYFPLMALSRWLGG
jgi:squalene-hopene/tetraprenyl-beta-curcumene cyclase